mmetsp:Transcript_70418/g.199667  ORF Transcript_70418/g.199667 Transcript_70418/m.199667 type:complete len:324 (+) Transcript_70418:989-1960(+)
MAARQEHAHAPGLGHEGAARPAGERRGPVLRARDLRRPARPDDARAEGADDDHHQRGKCSASAERSGGERGRHPEQAGHVKGDADAGGAAEDSEGDGQAQAGLRQRPGEGAPAHAEGGHHGRARLRLRGLRLRPPRLRVRGAAADGREGAQGRGRRRAPDRAAARRPRPAQAGQDGVQQEDDLQREEDQLHAAQCSGHLAGLGRRLLRPLRDDLSRQRRHREHGGRAAVGLWRLRDVQEPGPAAGRCHGPRGGGSPVHAAGLVRMVGLRRFVHLRHRLDLCHVVRLLQFAEVRVHLLLDGCYRLQAPPPGLQFQGCRTGEDVP